MPYPSHTFDDLEPGARFEAGPRRITREDIAAFADLSGDHTALHTDEEFARTTPLGGLVAHGVLTLAIATGLTHAMGFLNGTILAFREMTTRFDRPVRPGDEVSVTLTVASKDSSPRPGRGRVVFDVALRNQEGRTVLSGRWELLLRRSETPSAG